MSEKRYQVFVSSTFRDLRTERARVLRTLAEANYIAAGMEFFPAIDEEQFDFIKTVIDDSDYYVVIGAGKYGTLAPDGIGYSEKEYDYALEKSMPVIALIREDLDTLGAGKRETDPDIQKKLDAFRERLSTGRLVRFWNDETELCYRLLNSLLITAKRHPGNGWIRGGKDNPEDLLRKIVDLEEEYRRLYETFDEFKRRPLNDHIGWLLRNENMEIEWIRREEAEPAVDEAQPPVETRACNLNLLEAAQFLIPRLGRDLREDQYISILRDLVAEKVSGPVAAISPESADLFSATLAKFGLVSLTTDGVGRSHIMRTALGRRVVGDELVDSFEKQEQGSGVSVQPKGTGRQSPIERMISWINRL